MIKCLPARRETRVRFLCGKIPWRWKWQSTPAFLPGKSHGWRSLIGYSPWGRKESVTTERLHFHFHLICWLFRLWVMKSHVALTISIREGSKCHWFSQKDDTKDSLQKSREKLACVCAQLLQLCPVLSDPVDCSPPGSSVQGILQERIPEWVAMPSSRGSSQPRNQTHISCIVGRFFTSEPPGKPRMITYFQLLKELPCCSP